MKTPTEFHKIYFRLILALVLMASTAPTYSQAQSRCAKKVTVLRDMASQDSIGVQSRQPMIVSDDGMMTGLAIRLEKTTKATTLTAEPFGKSLCLRHGDEVEILFSNSSRMMAKHTGRGDCQTKLVIDFNSENSNMGVLQKLLSEPVSVLRINSKQTYVQTSFPSADASEFQKLLNCFN